MKRREIFITLAVLSGMLLSGCGKQDYSEAVAKQLSYYTGEFALLQCYEETVDGVEYEVYQYRTDDECEIVFEVKCHMGYKSFPLGGTYLTKSQIVTDNLYTSICDYYIGTLEPLVVDDMKIDAIIEYVGEQLAACQNLLEAYGVTQNPQLSLVLIKNEKTYTLSCSNAHEAILHDRIVDLLYK